MGPWLPSGFGTVRQGKKYVCSITRSIWHIWFSMDAAELGPDKCHDTCSHPDYIVWLILSGYGNDIRMIFGEITHLSLHFIPVILHRNLQPSPSYSKYTYLPHLLTLRRDYRRSSFHQSLPEAGRLYKTMWWLHRQNTGSQIPVKDYRLVSCLKLTPTAPKWTHLMNDRTCKIMFCLLLAISLYYDLVTMHAK